MPRIIVTSRYLKGSSSKQLSHFVQYIATRESVEFYSPKEKNTPATEKQTEFINSLLKEFPDGRNSLEYDDYKEKPISENASELISEIIERNADIIGSRENFVGYMAMRPGAEKIGTHGLFSQTDEEIVLSNVAKEVAEHKGNVWTHVVSLKREDAEGLGYNNAEAWRQLVRRHIQTVAEATKIDMHNLKWYAAFHNTTHHPHIHLLVYSANIRQGYLNQDGIENIRSSFANDIFQDELQHLYQEQTQTRDLLKAEANKFMKELSNNISDGNFENEKLEYLILKLSDQLKTMSGKKVYGYLPKAVKTTVDEILTELSKNETIAKMYEMWCRFENDKLRTYSNSEKEIQPIVNQKAFKSIKNIIIAEVLNMNSVVSGFEYSEADDFSELPELNEQGKDFLLDDEPAEQVDLFETENMPSDNIDKALDYFIKSAELKNSNTQYELGKQYILGEVTNQDIEKGLDFLIKSAESNPNAQYFLGKLYLDGDVISQDIDKAIDWLTKSAENKNSITTYKLGKIYLTGEYVVPNYRQAEKWLKLSADQNNEYAQHALGKLYLNENYRDYSLAEHWLTKATDLGNSYAMLSLARLYLGGEIPKDIEKAMELLRQSAEKGNSFASYTLGKLYLYGKDIPQNTEEAKYWLTLSSDQGNEFAKQLLVRMDNFQSHFAFGIIISLLQNLSRIISSDYNQNWHSNKLMVDRKLKRAIAKKKQALGIKEDHTITQGGMLY